MDEDGRVRCAFRVEKKHLNGMRNVHGGCFMTFADYCLFAFASPVLQGPGVTVSFGCEFLDAAREGELVECDGRDHARRRLADLPARRAEIGRTLAVHVFRHHQAGEVEAAGQSRRRCHLALQRSKRPAPAPPADPRAPGPARLARLCAAAGAGLLLEFDLSADQDRPRLDPADHLHLGALADRRCFLLTILYARGLRIPTDAKAWKLFAQQQTINSTIPFLMITWAQQYVAAAPTVVLASTTPIFAFLITWGITRHEPATLLKLAGAVLGLAGTAVIIGLDALGGLGGNIFAEMVILLATISFACATIFGLRLTEYDPMVVAAGSLLFGGLLLLPVALIVDHPWTLRPTTEALVATVAMGIFSSAFGLMLFYMCLTRLGTLTTNAQGYLRIPIGVGLSVVLLGETVPSNLALGLVLVMAGVAAMTIPGDSYRTLDRPVSRQARAEA